MFFGSVCRSPCAKSAQNLLNDELGILVVQQMEIGAENHLLNDDVVQQVVKAPIERRKCLVLGKNPAYRSPSGPLVLAIVVQ